MIDMYELPINLVGQIYINKNQAIETWNGEKERNILSGLIVSSVMITFQVTTKC